MTPIPEPVPSSGDASFETVDRGSRSSAPVPWRWIAVGIFFLSSSVNYLDRLLLAALGPTLMREFHLTNFEFGQITSAFSIVYAVIAPVAGLFIDRVGLNAGIMISMTVWSLAGCATGFTQSFRALLACRTVLGIGEAAGIPSTAKANGTYLEPRELALGTACNQVGISIGMVSAPLLVAAIAPRYGWRATFVVVGLLGLIWVPLWAFTSKMIPARKAVTGPMGAAKREAREIASTAVSREDAAPTAVTKVETREGASTAVPKEDAAPTAVTKKEAREIASTAVSKEDAAPTAVSKADASTAVSKVDAPMAVANILRDRRLWGLVIANALVMSVYTLWSNWTTIYFVHERHLTEIQANQNYVWIPSIFATLGGFFGGWLAYRWIRGGTEVLRARMRVCWTGAVVLLATAAVPLMPTPALATAAISLSFFSTLSLSVNMYAMPIDWFGPGRAAFGVSAITCSYGLMQAFLSPLIGTTVDHFGFNAVCVGIAALPLIGIGVLGVATRKPQSA